MVLAGSKGWESASTAEPRICSWDGFAPPDFISAIEWGGWDGTHVLSVARLFTGRAVRAGG